MALLGCGAGGDGAQTGKDAAKDAAKDAPAAPDGPLEVAATPDGGDGPTADGDAQETTADDADDEVSPVRCPAVPSPTEIPPVAPATIDSVVDLANDAQGRALISSPGAQDGEFSLYSTTSKTSLGGLGLSDGITRLVALTPNGAAAIGSSDQSRSILCNGTCIDLGTLATQGPQPSAPTAANDAPVVVGAAVVDMPNVSHPYRWSQGTMVDLGTLGGATGTARAVNVAGVVIGESLTAAGETHAFLYDTAMHDLGTLGGSQSQATAINAAGDVVGAARTAAGQLHAFRWHAGTMHDLGTLGGPTSDAVAINASGQILGNSQTASDQRHAFFWSGGVIQDLGTLGGTTARVASHGLNDAGQVVGTSTDVGSSNRAFVWQLGEMRSLGTLGGPGSTAVAINAAGRVVGNSSSSSGSARAFFVDPGLCVLSAGP